MSDTSFDVVIIGGGPAGASCAAHLAKKGHKVALYEQDAFPRFHVGESLLPEITPHLERLGVMDKIAAMPQVKKTGVEFGFAWQDIGTLFDFSLAAPWGDRDTFNVERAPFDSLLMAHAEACGATLLKEQKVTAASQLKDGDCQLETSSGTVHCKLVMDCSGQGSLLGRTLNLKKGFPSHRKTAFINHFANFKRLDGEKEGYPAIVMADDGWFWAIPINKTYTSIGFVADKTTVQRMRKENVPIGGELTWALERCPLLRGRLGEGDIIYGKNKVVADFSYQCHPATADGYILVGDAAAFLDPVFSSGLYLALAGAESASEAAHQILTGQSAPAARAKYLKHFENRKRVFFKYIRLFYDHAFREMLVQGRGPLGVHRALIAFFTGKVDPIPFGMGWRLKLMDYFLARHKKTGNTVPTREGWSLFDNATHPAGAGHHQNRRSRIQRVACAMTAPSSCWFQAQLTRHAQARPQQRAWFLDDHTLTWGELPARVEARRDALQDLPSGSTIGLAQTNSTNFVLNFLALIPQHRVLPLSPRLPTVARERLLNEAGATHWIGEDNTLENISSSQVPDSHLAHPPGLILSSSGTTGLPKLVFRHTHHLAQAAEVHAEAVGLQADDTVLACVPLTHSYGLEHGLLAPLATGCTTALEADFDPTAIGPAAEAAEATVLPGVPVVFEMLCHMWQKPLSKLRLAYSAGAHLPSSVWQHCREVLNLKVGQLYGTTETGSVACIMHPDSPPGAGHPMPGVKISLAADGEVQVQSPWQMPSYLNQAPVHGPFLTGDLGTLEADGQLRLTGRKKLMVDVGGSKVNPLEVEAELAQIPGVEQCVVLPDPVSPHHLPRPGARGVEWRRRIQQSRPARPFEGTSGSPQSTQTHQAG